MGTSSTTMKCKHGKRNYEICDKCADERFERDQHEVNEIIAEGLRKDGKP